ncbi:MAG TPA: hypothetical protein VFF43_07440 [Caldimonas sp.]|nr:hypothetical protein [Caldimonas sp.]
MNAAPALVPALARRNHGTGHVYTLDGEREPGVTAILQQVPKPALNDHGGKITAAYAVDHWDELSRMSVSERLDALNAVRRDELRAASKRGTTVHRLAAGLNAGERVAVPEELAGYVDSYLDFLHRVDPIVIAVELVVASRAHRYCGTADLVADLPALVLDGELLDPCRWLLDVKTGKGVYAESALQTTAYSRADVYLDGERVRPLRELRIKRCGVLHVRSDGWDLRPLDDGEDTWAYFLHLRWMHDRREVMREWVGAAVDPPQLVDA